MAERLRRFGKRGPLASGGGGPLEVVEPTVAGQDAAAQEAAASAAGAATAAKPTAAAGAEGTSVWASSGGAAAGANDTGDQDQQREQQGELEGLDEGEQVAARLLSGQVAPWETPVTSVAAFAVIAVALAQWWPLLGDVWWGLTNGSAGETLWQLATAVAETPATHALQLDADAVAHAGEWRRVLTAALLHSGVVPALAAADAALDAGLWLEAWFGGMGAAMVLLFVAAGAGLGHLLLSASNTGLTGAGAVVGLYVAWAVLSLTRAGGALPVSSAKGLVYVAIAAAAAAHQPVIGGACLAGGALGGALAVALAPAAARAAEFALAAPALAALFLARVSVETVRLFLLIALQLVIATGRAVVEVVRTVRDV